MLEYIRHLEELQIVSMMREFRIVLLRFRILEGGGGLKILKTWRGGIENLTIT
jgi:hypothetical protein